MIGKESEANFQTMLLAARNKDISIVSCTDAKGREFEVLCVLASVAEEEGYVYIPFGLMLTPSLYPLMNKLDPPPQLKGEWLWDDE